MSPKVVLNISMAPNHTKSIYWHYNCKIGWLVQAYVNFIVGTQKKSLKCVNRVALTVPFVPFLYEIFKHRWI